jgi:hypothetical protein
MAMHSKVSWGFANQVITELKALGAVVDPEVLRQKKDNVVGPGQKLSTVHEMFLLVLRTVNPAHPLYNYVQELRKHFGLLVSYQKISDWFKKRLDYKGNLKRANIVPLDKWKTRNKVRYYKFVQKLCIYSNHLKFNFINENTHLQQGCVSGKSQTRSLEWKTVMHPHQRQLPGGLQHNSQHLSEPR